MEGLFLFVAILSRYLERFILAVIIIVEPLSSEGICGDWKMVYRLKSQRPGTAITRPTEAHLLQRLHLHVLCIAGRAEDPLKSALLFS